MKTRLGIAGVATAVLLGGIFLAVLLGGVPVGQAPGTQSLPDSLSEDHVFAQATFAVGASTPVELPPQPPADADPERTAALPVGTPTPVMLPRETPAAISTERTPEGPGRVPVPRPTSSATTSPVASTPAATGEARAASAVAEKPISPTLAPGPGAMTIYSVTNPNSVHLDVQHVITGPSGFSHSFWSRVPPNSTVEYHLRDIVEVPRHFKGSLSLYADRPFAARIVGYDYKQDVRL